jgi:hypothetical protein
MTGATDRPATASPDDGELDDWLLRLPIVLARLRDFFLPADFPFDYSRGSLDRLEAVVLARHPLDEAVTGDGGAFVESAMAYVGECLLQAGGGRWAMGHHPADPDQSVPVVCPDQALGEPPISPLHLVIDAIGERTGKVFAGAQQALIVAVAGQRARNPAWSLKVPDPAVPPDDQEPAPPPVFLPRWLAERDRAFPGWLRDHAGAPDRWDFSRESLDALQALARRRLPGGGADFERPEHREFVAGAVWYYGEVIRRVVDAQWDYIDGDPSANHYAGRPFVRTTGRDRNSKIPVYALMSAVESDNPHYLRQTLRLFE